MLPNGSRFRHSFTKRANSQPWGKTHLLLLLGPSLPPGCTSASLPLFLHLFRSVEARPVVVTAAGAAVSTPRLRATRGHRACMSQPHQQHPGQPPHHGSDRAEAAAIEAVVPESGHHVQRAVVPPQLISLWLGHGGSSSSPPSLPPPFLSHPLDPVPGIVPC
jgi:hypothetical protein